MTCDSCNAVREDLNEMRKMLTTILSRLDNGHFTQQQSNSSSNSMDTDTPPQQHLDLNNVNTRKRGRDGQTASSLAKLQKVSAEQVISLDDIVISPESIAPTTPTSLDGLVSSNSNGPVEITQTNLTKSLYVKGFQTFVQATHVMRYLGQVESVKHIVPDITCTRLMTNKKRKHRLTFVSFRIDVPRQSYELFANPEVWKCTNGQELEIKEFDLNRRGRGSLSSNSSPSALASKTNNQKAASKPKPTKNNNKNATVSKNAKAAVKNQPKRRTQSSGQHTNALQAQAQQLLGDLLQQVLSQHHPPRTQYNTNTKNYRGNHQNRRW